jgi:hypothetical protein
MVFKFISKPKANISIESQSKSLPGALLPVEIRISAQEEIKARELRAELVGEETYYTKETHRDSKGHIQTRIVQRTDAIARITQTVADQPTLMQGMEQKWNISLQIPSEAPPTCSGKVVNIKWKLKVVLDVPNQPDQSQEMPLFVLSRAPQTTNVKIFPAEKIFDSVRVNLEVSPIASPGETLIGRLNLQMKDKLSIQGIRVELVQLEDAGDRKADEVLLKTEILGSTSFNPSEAPSFNFSLKIPADAPSTATSVHSSLRWMVKAVVARRMKSDFNVEQGVIVFNASERT